MSRVRGAGLVLAWLLVVVAASTAAWAVIRSAGSDVVATPPVPATTSTADAAPTPSRTPRPSATRSPRSRPSTPSTTPSTVPRPVPATPTTPAPSSTPARPASPPDEPTVRRTWRGQAGELTVSCSGSTARLVSVTPSSGWRVEVEERGPARVRVKLETREQETSVSGRCDRGTPTFTQLRDDD